MTSWPRLSTLHLCNLKAKRSSRRSQPNQPARAPIKKLKDLKMILLKKYTWFGDEFQRNCSFGQGRYCQETGWCCEECGSCRNQACCVLCPDLTPGSRLCQHSSMNCLKNADSSCVQVSSGCDFHYANVGICSDFDAGTLAEYSCLQNANNIWFVVILCHTFADLCFSLLHDDSLNNPRESQQWRIHCHWWTVIDSSTFPWVTSFSIKWIY